MNWEQRMTAAVTLGCFVAVGWCLGQARGLQHGVWQAKPEPHPKVVLIYDHRQVIEGKEYDIVRVNPKAVVAFALLPLDHQAVLEPESYMICEPFAQPLGKVQLNGEVLGETQEIAFRCGGKRYLFSKLDIQ